MSGDIVKYCAGYKYQLVEDYSKTNGHCFQTGILGFDIKTQFITLTPDGFLDIKAWYAWDGCSGPTYDDDTNMRGGLIHDALYQLMRLGLLPMECRAIADKILKQECLKDGMWKIRAWWYFEGVDHFAKFAAEQGACPYPILCSPKRK
jgi:hypothetical protein